MRASWLPLAYHPLERTDHEQTLATLFPGSPVSAPALVRPSARARSPTQSASATMRASRERSAVFAVVSRPSYVLPVRGAPSSSPRAPAAQQRRRPAVSPPPPPPPPPSGRPAAPSCSAQRSLHCDRAQHHPTRPVGDGPRPLPSLPLPITRGDKGAAAAPREDRRGGGAATVSGRESKQEKALNGRAHDGGPRRAAATTSAPPPLTPSLWRRARWPAAAVAPRCAPRRSTSTACRAAGVGARWRWGVAPQSVRRRPFMGAVHTPAAVISPTLCPLPLPLPTHYIGHRCGVAPVASPFRERMGVETVAVATHR